MMLSRKLLLGSSFSRSTAILLLNRNAQLYREFSNTRSILNAPPSKTSDTDNDTTTRNDAAVEDGATVATANTNSNDGVGRGILKSVLYGQKESSHLGQANDTTHSKKLARGKYVHEMQTHRVKPDKVDEYIKLLSIHYPLIASNVENNVHLCGSWETVVGEQDTFVHIWEYKGYPGHKATLERLSQDPDYQRFIKDLRPLLISRENNIMLEFSFWKTSPPRVTNGIYELRKYNLKPGNLLEWEYHWRRGLECRSQFCEPVGAWFSQLGNLHQVQHMWTYPDLQTRKTTREAAWNVDGWSDTVYKTVRLVDSMHSFILKPLDYSPLR